MIFYGFDMLLHAFEKKMKNLFGICFAVFAYFLIFIDIRKFGCAFVVIGPVGPLGPVGILGPLGPLPRFPVICSHV